MSKITLQDLQCKEKPDWCPGCGDHAILMAVKKALIKLEKPLEEVCIVTGIGCSGKFNHFVHTYGFEGIHGRALPVAQAIHLANHDLSVIAVGGDGDGYGIGAGHFIHAMRRNHDMTYIVHDNQIYGLTKGQYSPTTEQGEKSSSSPHGALEYPMNPIHLALASEGVTFIARGYAGNIKQLAEIIVQAVQHKGFSYIDVLQPCVTFNKLNTYEFFKSRVYKLEEDDSYDKTSKEMAWKRSDEWDERIATGVLYQVDKPLYEDSIQALKDKPLVQHSIENIDITPLYKDYQ